MKAFFNEFFYIPKQGKIREKVLLCHIALTVVFILFCLIAMSLTAYAYFSASLSSTQNVAQAAYFDVEPSVSGDVNFVKSPQNHYTAQLDANTYTFTVKHSGTTETGFLVISFSGNDHEYHTAQIDTEITFTITVNNPTEITLIPHWGTSSKYGHSDTDYYIDNNASVTIDITPTNVMAEPVATPTPEATATPTVEPAATATVKPQATATPTKEPTPTVTPEPTVEPTATPATEPTATPVATPTVTPTEEPSETPLSTEKE